MSVYAAFAFHRAWKLRPDDIWVTVQQGLTMHVHQNPEKYRDLLVSHKEGKELIEFRKDGLIPGAAAWQTSINDLAKEVRKRGETKMSAMLSKSFSTTDSLAQTSQDVALLDCVQAFFAYRVQTMCGIPRIELLGTVEDWLLLNKSIGEIPFDAFDLDFWRKDLCYVSKNLLAIAKGEGSVAFGKDAYRRNSASGSEKVDGWIVKLYPYVRDCRDKIKWVVNQRLNSTGKKEDDLWCGPGISPNHFPVGLSSVPFVWDVMGKKHEMRLWAGFGDPVFNADGSVSPQHGFAVIYKETQPADAVAPVRWEYLDIPFTQRST